MAAGANRSSLVITAALAAVALGALPVHAAETGLSGLWLLERGQFGGREAPALTPAAAADMEVQRKNPRVMTDISRLCLPVGMPRMMVNELPLEIVESPERIAIVSEQTELGRTVYMNTAVHPSDTPPAWNGNSYGKWEGSTLVVDTIGFNDRTTHIPGTAKGSTSTHLVEKYHLENGGKVLVIEMTFDDPKVLTRPYTVSYRYDRQPAGAQRWEYVCDTQDPGWNSALGVKPGK